VSESLEAEECLLSPASVLVVDTTMENVAAALAVLARARSEVHAVCDSAEALVALRRPAFWNLVVVGQGVGASHTLHLVREIRALPEAPGVVVASDFSDDVAYLVQQWCAVAVPAPLTERSFYRAAFAAISLPKRWFQGAARVTRGRVVIDLATDTVWVDGIRKPELRGMPYRLLRYLALNENRLVEWPEIESQVIGAPVSNAARSSLTHRLRAALGADKDLIVTTRGACALVATAAARPLRLAHRNSPGSATSDFSRS